MANAVSLARSILNQRAMRADGGPAPQPQNQPQPDESGFYSHAEYAAQNLPQAKGTPDQMRAMLMKAGVKPDEMKWTQLDDWLQTKPVVTRDEMVEHLRNNRVQIGESQPGGPIEVGEPQRAIGGSYNVETSIGPHKIVPFTDGDEDEYGEPRERYSIRKPDGSYHGADFDSIGEALNHLKWNAKGGTKFDEYTLPGGDNYREVLLTRPGEAKTRKQYRLVDESGETISAASDEAAVARWRAQDPNARIEEAMIPETRAGQDGQYRSSHWDEPNVLAHLRMKDRVDPQGRKVLHLEELQSDWAQEGRKKGFAEAATRTMPGRVEPDEYGSFRVVWEDGSFSGGLSRDSAEATAARGKTNEKVGLPSAPFVDNTAKWTNLALKRALIEAAKSGHDVLAWTPGEEQAKRFDLSKRIHSIAYNPESKMLIALDKEQSHPVINDTYQPDQLESVIGKDVAKKLLGSERNPSGYHLIAGDDLRVGGEGMKSFYDKIVPTQLKKLAKEMGEEAKFDTVKLPGLQGRQQHSLTDEEFDYLKKHGDDALKDIDLPALVITPTMREKIKKGLPLFASGGAVDQNDEGIVAYHGTPHDFDQFDLSKIGSGQGEQAYGHGLYFASNEDLAKSYRDDLSSGVQMIDGRPAPDLAREGYGLDEISPEHEIASYISQYGRQARDVMRIRSPHLIDQFDAMHGAGRIQPGGKMYQVSIKAHPEQILDWDRPLEEQPHVMQRMIEAHTGLDPEHPKFQYLDQAHKNIMEEGNKGAHAHYYLRSTLGNQGASDYLNQMGIKGIKYLDQGSRGAGEGTHNYVIFDDKIVNVAKKYADGGAIDDDTPYHQTPEFQNWFGNSVAHENGVPTTFYHGTSKDVDFPSFKMSRHGVWLTPDPKEASNYAEQNDSQGFKMDGWEFKKTNTASRVIPVHLKAEKPFTGPMPREFATTDNYKKAQSDFFDTLRSQGYDSWIPQEQGGLVAVALKDPTQVKSIYNRKFDPKQKRIDRFAGGRVNTNPTEAQKEAGNYRKGHTSFQGLDITIENPKGSSRHGVDGGGKKWSVTMPAHYGYIKRTEGADGDHVDVYLGPSKDSKRVFVVDQQDHKTKCFDEHKVMLGYDREEDALKAYKRAFSDGNGSARIKHVTEMSVAEFKIWLRHCNTKKPVKSRSIVDRALSTLSRKS